LDNFEEKELEEQSFEENKNTDENEDIKFEETIDINELQKQLQEKIEREKSGIEPEDDSKNNEFPALINKTVVPKNHDQRSKKYVIYINPDNVDYMENLSIDERRDMINKILKEQNEESIKQKTLEARKRLVANVFLSCITFVIFFPLLFLLVNKATETSINNYNQAKGNFVKLYRAQGKIKEAGN
jgi:hypothetical protein